MHSKKPIGEEELNLTNLGMATAEKSLDFIHLSEF